MRIQFANAPIWFALLVSPALVATISSRAAFAEERPDWGQAQHEVSRILWQPNASIVALVRQVSQTPATNGQEAMFRLAVFMRAGLNDDAVNAVADLKRLDPKLGGGELDGIYYEACDHAHNWAVSQKLLETFADVVSVGDLENRLIKHFQESGWSVDKIDAWLADKPKGSQNFWIKERLRFNVANHREQLLEKQLADAVRAHPDDVAGALAYLAVLAEVHYDPNTTPDVAWVSEVVKPKLASDASEMAR
ncbi:MAG TPA: hypothetical protein VGJ15_10690, partial [Pirellulales bacterium]